MALSTDEFDAAAYGIELTPQLPRENIDDFGADGWPGYDDMARFWMGWKSWLTARGFTPTVGIRGRTSGAEAGSVQWYTSSYVAPAGLPYASCVRGENPRTEGPLPATRIAWAQDAMRRDVVLKLTNTWSDEYRIYHRLLDLASTLAPGECWGVLLPVAILNTPHNFAFVVMPMWGHINNPSDLGTVRDVVQFMRCTSKGLRLLHENRIVHRDVHQSNMLVNTYCPELQWPEELDEFLTQRRGAADVHYCLLDFNISLQLPLDTSLTACRRPSDGAFDGAPSYHPFDVALGEHEYNPFAFDVACLGNLYRVNFSMMVPLVPLLAPLFDRMTTHVISQRFTAIEASDFIISMFSQLSEETLNTPLNLYTEWECCSDTDIYWSRVPIDLRSEWIHYRTPRIPWTRRALDRLTDLPIGWRVIRLNRSGPSIVMRKLVTYLRLQLHGNILAFQTQGH